MPKRFVLTLTGPDRIGVVKHVTELIVGRGGMCRPAAWRAWGANLRC